MVQSKYTIKIIEGNQDKVEENGNRVTKSKGPRKI